MTLLALKVSTHWRGRKWADIESIRSPTALLRMMAAPRETSILVTVHFLKAQSPALDPETAVQHIIKNYSINYI